MFDLTSYLTQLKLKRLHEDAIVPTYANEGDNGLDLYALNNVIVPSGECKLIKTGWAMELTNPNDYTLLITPRSGLALKHQLTVLNSPGLIDSGYRNDVGVVLMNHGKNDFPVEKGMRIAQLIIVSFLRMPTDRIVEVDELSVPQSRDKAGFGSSGV